MVPYSTSEPAGQNSPFTSECKTTHCLPSPAFGIAGKMPTGNAVETVLILTTTPNSLLAEVHDRMPVILEPENDDLWLDPGSQISTR